jgi:hypothetical protein
MVGRLDRSGATTEAAQAKGGVMTDHHVGRTAFTTDRSLEFFSESEFENPDWL